MKRRKRWRKRVRLVPIKSVMLISLKGVVRNSGERLVDIWAQQPMQWHPCSWSNMLIGCNCLWLDLVCFPFTEPELYDHQRFFWVHAHNGYLEDHEERFAKVHRKSSWLHINNADREMRRVALLHVIFITVTYVLYRLQSDLHIRVGWYNPWVTQKKAQCQVIKVLESTTW